MVSSFVWGQPMCRQRYCLVCVGKDLSVRMAIMKSISLFLFAGVCRAEPADLQALTQFRQQHRRTVDGRLCAAASVQDRRTCVIVSMSIFCSGWIGRGAGSLTIFGKGPFPNGFFLFQLVLATVVCYALSNIRHAFTGCTAARDPAGASGRPWCYVEAQVVVRGSFA